MPTAHDRTSLALLLVLRAGVVLAACSFSRPSRADDERADFTSQGQVQVLEAGQVAAPVAAPPENVREFSGQRNFGIVAVAGANGLGLGLRGGAQWLGLEATGTWAPELETYAQKPGDVAFKFFSTFQLNAMAYWSFYRSSPRTDMGIAGEYHYNSLLRHGGGLSFYIQYDVANKLALHATAGVHVFPDAEAQLRATGRFPEGGSISSGLSAVKIGLGVNIAFFP